MPSILITPMILLVSWIIILRFPWPALRDPETNDPPIGFRIAMMIVVSVIVLGSSLYVILSTKFDTVAQKWAFGIVGVIVGFWFNQKRDE
jgi:hypothetical protein